LNCSRAIPTPHRTRPIRGAVMRNLSSLRAWRVCVKTGETGFDCPADRAFLNGSFKLECLPDAAAQVVIHRRITVSSGTEWLSSSCSTKHRRPRPAADDKFASPPRRIRRVRSAGIAREQSNRRGTINLPVVAAKQFARLGQPHRAAGKLRRHIDSAATIPSSHPASGKAS